MNSILLRLVLFCALICTARAETNFIQPLNLETVLKLAGANNLDLKIAKERLAESRANYDGTLLQFFPAITPGAAYRLHNNLIQDVEGNLIGVDKESYSAGPALIGQWDLGDAIFQRLAARQVLEAAARSVDAQNSDTLLLAVESYFELLRTQAAEDVAREAIRISTNYLAQLRTAVDAGLAFKADLLRVQTQVEKNQSTLAQAIDRKNAASAVLAEALHLRPPLQLLGNRDELVPIQLVDTNTPLDSLVAQAITRRPELKSSEALARAAKRQADSATKGPWVPSVGAQLFAGGLGGGRRGIPDTFGESEDYQVTLGWRIGPGGLLDQSRIKRAEARLNIANLEKEKVSDRIMNEVVVSHSRVESQRDQMLSTRRGLEAAEETLRLSEQRKQFAVANVLEVIFAEQDLTRARLDYFEAIAEYDKAQYRLAHALGGLSGTPAPPARQ